MTKDLVLNLLNHIIQTRPGFDEALEQIRAERELMRRLLQDAYDDKPGWVTEVREVLR